MTVVFNVLLSLTVKIPVIPTDFTCRRLEIYFIASLPPKIKLTCLSVCINQFPLKQQTSSYICVYLVRLQKQTSRYFFVRIWRRDAQHLPPLAIIKRRSCVAF